MTSTTKPRVAIFVDDLSATGVVKNAIAIARELDHRGASVEFVATVATGTLRSAVPDTVPVTRLLPEDRQHEPRRARLRGSLIAYRRYLKRFGAGVLLSAGNQGHLASAIATVGLRELRLVVRISNELERQGKRRAVRRLLKARWLASRADRLVFVSQALAVNWAAAGAVGDDKAIVIPNGVDVDEVRRLADAGCDHPWLSPATGVPVVLAIGRLVEQKNISTLIDAVAIAARTQPVRLLVIGTGPLHERLIAEAACAGIASAFQIIPPVPNPIPYMKRAAVLALPSWWEGASNVLLEAVACGTPVVASRSAGSAPEVLADGRYGLLVDPGDPHSLARALLTQLSAEAVMPGGRASEFDRRATVRAYADLILALAG